MTAASHSPHCLIAPCRTSITRGLLVILTGPDDRTTLTLVVAAAVLGLPPARETTFRAGTQAVPIYATVVDEPAGSCGSEQKDFEI